MFKIYDSSLNSTMSQHYIQANSFSYLDMRIQSKPEQLESLNYLATKCTSVIMGLPHSPSKSTSSLTDTINSIFSKKPFAIYLSILLTNDESTAYSSLTVLQIVEPEKLSLRTIFRFFSSANSLHQVLSTPLTTGSSFLLSL